MVPHKQFPEPTGPNDLAPYRPQAQALGMPMVTSPTAHQPGHHEALGPALWRRRWSIAAITVLAVVVGVAYIHHAPKLYKGEAQIVLNTNQVSLSPLGGQVVSQTQDPTWINTKIDEIQSTQVLMAAAVKLGLDKKYSSDDLQAMVDSWGRNLYVDPGSHDQKITITFEDPDGVRAALVANAIVEAYQDYEWDNSKGNTSRTLQSLQTSAQSLSATRLKQFNELEKFKSDNPEFMESLTPDAKGGFGLDNADIRKLQDAITTAGMEEVTDQADLDSAVEARANSDKLRQVAGAATVAQLDPQGQTLRAQLSSFDMSLDLLVQKGFLKNSPMVVQLQAAIDEVRRKIDSADLDFADAYVGALTAKLTSCKAKITGYKAQLQQAQAGYIKNNTIAAEFSRLSDQLADTTGVMDKIDGQIKQLNVVGSTTVDVQWIEKARAEKNPNLPAKYRILALSLAIGLLLGIGTALLRDRLDQRLHTPEEVVGLLGVPVIGIIPHMRRTLTPVARGQAVHWDPMSEVAEAYRAVRTAVTFGVPAGAAKTIVVTSPTPGDGKSTLASNLAIALAQAGKRTLLLDADFRRPVQHKLFEMNHEMGVTSVLAGRDPLTKAIQKTACEGLDLLPSGPIPLNPSELLNGESFAEILDELAGVYDHIVLDCPPVMSVTNARILGAVCDVTILVVRFNKVTRRNVEHARAMLASVGARLLGCVINDVPRGQGAEGYYGGYGYAPIEPVVRRREDMDPAGINGHRHLPAPVDAGNGR